LASCPRWRGTEGSNPACSCGESYKFDHSGKSRRPTKVSASHQDWVDAGGFLGIDARTTHAISALVIEDGLVSPVDEGTPQGGPLSPLLANLFLHYAFDRWMRRNHPGIPFERYADDAICHCRSGDQAQALRASLEKRFAECGLRLHPEKTKIVYCKDDDRRGDYPDQKFDFLGYTFRPRLSRRWRGTFGVSFSPAAYLASRYFFCRCTFLKHTRLTLFFRSGKFINIEEQTIESREKVFYERNHRMKSL
jgi:reverse transcriptase-like protein